MIVHFGIQSLDALRFVQKHLSQPFRRHLGVIRVQGQCFLVGLLDELICPVIQGHRRVEAAEHHRLTATPHGLHHAANKVFTGQLGKFLEPYPPKEALCGLDRLDFAVIVQPSEDDLCACRKVGAAHRGHGAAPQVRYAQHVNSPLDLCKHGFPQGTAPPPEHHSRAGAGGVFLDAVHDLQRHKGRFAGAAPTGKIVVGVCICGYILVYGMVYSSFVLGGVDALHALKRGSSGRFPGL